MQQISGKVVNARFLPTVKVEVVRRWTHRLYHKTLTKKKNYLVHSKISVKEGDRVVLVPCRPVSKNKKWQVLKKL